MGTVLFCGSMLYPDLLLICRLIKSLFDIPHADSWIGLKGPLIRGWINEMKKLSIHPQIKSVHSGYIEFPFSAGVWYNH